MGVYPRVKIYHTPITVKLLGCSLWSRSPWFWGLQRVNIQG